MMNWEKENRKKEKRKPNDCFLVLFFLLLIPIYNSNKLNFLIIVHE